MSGLPKVYKQFQKEFPEVWEHYTRLGESAANAGPLDEKTRELVKLGMAAATKSMSAVQSHTHRALETGASADEIQHAILLGITTIGFPGMMAAMSWAYMAIQEHKP